MVAAPNFDSGAAEVITGTDCRIHPTAVLGYIPTGVDSVPTRIGDRVEIGAFCVVEAGVAIGDDVSMCHHSVVAYGALVGARTQIVQPMRIDARARVGTDCIIGGNVPDRAVVGNYVTMMGELAHSYPDGALPWGETDEVSPIVQDGTIIAQGVQVIGGVVIGRGSYIATGEVIRSDVAPGTLVTGGKRVPIERARGLIRARPVP